MTLTPQIRTVGDGGFERLRRPLVASGVYSLEKFWLGCGVFHRDCTLLILY